MVSALRKIPGVTVEVGHDDFLVGYNGDTFWIEWKAPDAISPTTGVVRPSEITPSEQRRLSTWKGHYCICWSLDMVLRELGIG